MPRSRVKQLLDLYFGVTEEEQKLFLDFIAPEPEPEPEAEPKKRRTRTPRTGLPDAAKDAKANEPQSNGQLCTAKIPGLGVECGDPADNRVHDKSAGYAGYHPFESSAPVAEKKSRRRGAAASSTQSTETNSENVLTAGAGGD